MNANAKAFVPNAGAKAFVPGGGFGGGGSAVPTSSSASTAPAIPPPPQPKTTAFYRYTIHCNQQVTKPTSDSSDSAAVPLLPAAQAFSVPQMLNAARLRSSAGGGGPSVEALNDFATTYFHSLMARADLQRIGFLAATEMLTPGSVHYDILPGYLLPLVLSSRPNQDHTRQLVSAWHTLVSELQNNPNVKGIGHMVRQWKQDDDTPSLDSSVSGSVPVLLHYFFIVLSAPDVIPREKIFDTIQMARQVIPVSNILPMAFDACRTTAAFYFQDSCTTPEEELSKAIKAEPGLAEAIPIEVDSNGRNLDSLVLELNEKLLQVVDAQTNSVTPRSIILKLSSSSQSSSNPSNSSIVRTSNGHNQLRFSSLLNGNLDRGMLTPDAVRLIARLCWDHLIIPSCVLVPDGNLLEKVKAAAAATPQNPPLRWDEVSPVFSLLNCFALKQLLPPAEAASRLNRTAATVPSDAIPTIAKQPELVAALPIVANTSSPFAASCFSPVEDPVSYQVVQDLLLQAQVAGADKDEHGDSKRVKRLRRSTKQQAGQAISSEAYRLRRTFLGEAVFLIVDSLQNLFVVDAASRSFIAALPTWRNTTTNSPLAWSGILPPGVGNCVLEGTMVPNYRREGQFKIVVEDVLVWNGSALIEQQNLNLNQRMQEVEGSVLEEEHHWCAPSPAGVAILRASIFPLAKGPQLLNTFFSEHPTMGITFVPVHNYRGGKARPASEEQREAERLYAWSWQSPESCTFNFLAGAVEDVTEAAKTSAAGEQGEEGGNEQQQVVGEGQKINRLTLQCTTATDDEEEEKSTAIVPYNDEYVDYYASTAPGVTQFSTVQCLLVKDTTTTSVGDGPAAAGSGAAGHFWEVVSEYSTADRAVVDSKKVIESFVNDPCPVSDEVNWLCQAPHHQRPPMN